MVKQERRRKSELVPRDPFSMRPEELDALIRDCEQKVDRMEAFGESEEWALQRKRLEARRDMLEHEMTGLRRRLVKPVAGQPPVTLEQLAYQEGRIEENRDLLRFPKMTTTLWRQQVDQLREIRARSA